MERISIIIPVMRLKKTLNKRYFYKNIWGIKETVDSISKSNLNMDFEFVFVQNGINDELNSFLNEILKVNKGRVVCISENIGVARAWNIGVMACESEILIISNDDVEFASNSIKVLLEKLLEDVQIGQIGPEGGDWHLDKSGERKGIKEVEAVDEISGYFFITKKSVFNLVGGFDEYYTPAGVEEIDYSFKVRNAGFKCVVIPETGIKHHGYHGVSAKPQNISYFDKVIDTHSLDKRNRAYFLDKWYGKK